MIASEAAAVWLATVPVVAMAAIGLGVLASPVGMVGMVVSAMAWAAEWEVWRRSRAGAALVGPLVDLPASPLLRAVSWPWRLPGGIERLTLAYADHPHDPRPLMLDLYRPTDRSASTGVVIHLHGGAWRGGNPRQSGRVAIHHLVRQGWAVAAIEYPLSPQATFPDHLYGLDQALRWVHERPDLSGPVVVMGFSAGAHLAAMAGLTRTGFDGVIGLYGIYDMSNRHRIRADWPLIPELVMKCTIDDYPDRYRQASPVDLVHRGAPPFLLVHGTFDSLVPPAESRFFAAALEAEGVATSLVEVPWAQHGFDTLAGRRARAVAGTIGDWLTKYVTATNVGRETSPPDPPE